VNVELLHHAAAVRLRVLVRSSACGDLLRRHAFGDQLQYLTLARRQRIDACFLLAKQASTTVCDTDGLR